MPVDRDSRGTPTPPSNLRTTIKPFQHSDLHRSLIQVANTFIPYFALSYLMYLSLSVSYWLTLALSVLTGGFLIRIFIILHDCGHGSFFRSQLANDVLGSICGVFTFTPYFQWRHDHAVHHATTSDLDRRGWGDVHTLTVAEYLGLSRWEQFKYRLFRNPVTLLGFGPAWAFVISQRIPLAHSRPRERWSVYGTNLALVVLIGGLCLAIGWQAYLLIHVPVTLVAATVAVWLFYCQHQFEGAYWARHEEWDFERAALEGSSYFELPRVLQWFTGNIGFHHVHHLSPRIPNYYLEACHKAHPRFQDAPKLTIWSSFATFELKLWDEERRELVPLRTIRQARSGQESEQRAPALVGEAKEAGTASGA